MKRLAALICATFLTACATTASRGTDFTSCAAYAPAFEITDAFMASFNREDIAGHEGTLHFPHVRIASGQVLTVPDRGTDWMARSYARLHEQGWHHSAWADRRVVQCGPTKAHLLTTFVRYRADGSELSRFDSLYVIEFKDGYWGVTARSSFAE